jgi:hypothetical protein
MVEVEVSMAGITSGVRAFICCPPFLLQLRILWDLYISPLLCLLFVLGWPWELGSQLNTLVLPNP